MIHDAIPCPTVDDVIGRGSLAVTVAPLLPDWISEARSLRRSPGATAQGF